MKKQIASLLGVALLSTGAFASKARLQALGEDTFGSFFVDDARNVTLNPAMLNFHKDFITFEWGNTASSSFSDNGSFSAPGVPSATLNGTYDAGIDYITGQDGANSPKAEGGMFKASGNMVYGLYFGDESNTGNILRAAAMGTSAVQESNNMSFYVAGDAGVQWGVKLSYHDYQNKQGGADISSSATRAAVGIISGDVEAFLKFGLSNKAENGAAEFTGKGSYQLGVTYAMGDLDYLVELRGIELEDAGKNKYKAQFTRLGVAKTYKLNDKATAWASAWYKMDNDENKMTLSGAPGEIKRTYLPVTMAVEVMAKDWLALRGSVGANVIGTIENDAGDKATIANSTLVNAGAGLIFGDLTIDGLIGNSDNNQTVGESTAGGNGTLRTDTLLSRVSMTYKF